MQLKGSIDNLCLGGFGIKNLKFSLAMSCLDCSPSKAKGGGTGGKSGTGGTGSAGGGQAGGGGARAPPGTKLYEAKVNGTILILGYERDVALNVQWVNGEAASAGGPFASNVPVGPVSFEASFNVDYQEGGGFPTITFAGGFSAGGFLFKGARGTIHAAYLDVQANFPLPVGGINVEIEGQVFWGSDEALLKAGAKVTNIKGERVQAKKGDFYVRANVGKSFPVGGFRTGGEVRIGWAQGAFFAGLEVQFPINGVQITILGEFNSKGYVRLVGRATDQDPVLPGGHRRARDPPRGGGPAGRGQRHPDGEDRRPGDRDKRRLHGAVLERPGLRAALHAQGQRANSAARVRARAGRHLRVGHRGPVREPERRDGLRAHHQGDAQHLPVRRVLHLRGGVRRDNDRREADQLRRRPDAVLQLREPCPAARSRSRSPTSCTRTARCRATVAVSLGYDDYGRFFNDYSRNQLRPEFQAVVDRVIRGRTSTTTAAAAARPDFTFHIDVPGFLAVPERADRRARSTATCRASCTSRCRRRAGASATRRPRSG